MEKELECPQQPVRLHNGRHLDTCFMMLDQSLILLLSLLPFFSSFFLAFFFFLFSFVMYDIRQLDGLGLDLCKVDDFPPGLIQLIDDNVDVQRQARCLYL